MKPGTNFRSRVLEAASKRFSKSRLKDLGDEYAENFANISIVLGRFFGLGRSYTFSGVEAFIKKLLVDEEVKSLCGSWIYDRCQPDAFIELLYAIGFFGVVDDDGRERYRSVGTLSPTRPPATRATVVCIHPSYVDALALQDVLVSELGVDTSLQTDGVVMELPDALSPADFQARVTDLANELQSLPRGQEAARKFEELVGETLRLCFFRQLKNLQPQERSHDGAIRRDWIASVVADRGFWANMRQRYNATQVVFECKNYDELDAGDFQQLNYYLTDAFGGLGFIVFRGEHKPHYFNNVTVHGRC